MDDFFRKEITPFAKIEIGEKSILGKIEIKWLERWKFIDAGVYNRAVKIQWDMIANLPKENWTEFQRRVKHLIATRLELDTMLEWIAEEVHQGYLKLIRLPESDEPIAYNQNFNFWMWDQEIKHLGVKACLFEDETQLRKELDNLMVAAIQAVLALNSDAKLIELKKQMNEVLREIYDLIICTCPWEGRISGGPMLPNQKIEVNIEPEITKLTGHFEFVILGARPADLDWIKDLKLPALSHSAQVWIHHGARRNEES